MSYLAKTDIEDELLKPLIQDSDLIAGDEYLQYVADRLDVTAIHVPLLPLAKQLVIAVACARRAKLKTGMNPAKFQNSEGGDAYELKRKAYQKEVDALTAQIVFKDLTGVNPAQSTENPFWVIDMYRG